MSTGSIVLFSVILFLFQSSLLPFFFNGINQPDIWLTAIALAALIMDRKSAMILAVIGGFLQDIVIGNFFGLHLLPYLLITFLLINTGKHRYNKHWCMSLLAVILSSAVYLVISGMIMGWAGGHYPSSAYLIYLGIPMILMNGGCSLILHHIMWMLKHEEEPRW